MKWTQAKSLKFCVVFVCASACLVWVRPGLIVAENSVATGKLGIEGPLYSFVFLAVMEGLYEDNVSNDIVDMIIPPRDEQLPDLSKHFVYGCPLCMPAYCAFYSYRQRPPIPNLKNPEPVYNFGPMGLDDELVSHLAGSDAKAQSDALQQIVQTWIKRRLDRLNISEDERAALAREIELGRKQGMDLLKRDAGKTVGKEACQVCDGAFGACNLNTDNAKP